MPGGVDPSGAGPWEVPVGALEGNAADVRCCSTNAAGVLASLESPRGWRPFVVDPSALGVPGDDAQQRDPHRLRHLGGAVGRCRVDDQEVQGHLGQGPRARKAVGGNDRRQGRTNHEQGKVAVDQPRPGGSGNAHPTGIDDDVATVVMKGGALLGHHIPGKGQGGGPG